MKVFDIVELTEDIPEEGLVSGQRGTIVEVYEHPPGFEVEFTDAEGVTVALLGLRAEQLRAVRG